VPAAAVEDLDDAVAVEIASAVDAAGGADLVDRLHLES
jgi:hypothetical protein